MGAFANVVKRDFKRRDFTIAAESGQAFPYFYPYLEQVGFIKPHSFNAQCLMSCLRNIGNYSTREPLNLRQLKRLIGKMRPD